MGLLSWRKPNSSTRTCWDYKFDISRDHLTPGQMNLLKYSYDTLGDEALKRLQVLSKRFSKPESHNDPSSDTYKHSEDHYTLLKENANKDEVLRQLWKEINTVPTWVSWDQISRGQDCFYRYGGPMLTGLAFQSLLGGMVRLNLL